MAFYFMLSVRNVKEKFGDFGRPCRVHNAPARVLLGFLSEPVMVITIGCLTLGSTVRLRLLLNQAFYT